jgi:hypothetical protein
VSARQEAESPAMTLKAWAACLTVSWFAMQTVDLAFRVLQ